MSVDDIEDEIAMASRGRKPRLFSQAEAQLLEGLVDTKPESSGRIWYGGGETDPSLDEKPERRTTSAPPRV